MANRKYDVHFYNEYQKQRYLKTLEDIEHTQIRRILGRVGKTESLLNKDLYDFGLSEISRFLRYLNPNKLSMSRSNIYAINNYIEWANKEGLRQTNINPLHGMIDEDFIRRFVDESKKTLFSEDEINDIIARTVNYQDKALIRLAFEGVVGDEVAELSNLQFKNIDFANSRLLLTDKDRTTREITVSEECMKFVRGAISECEYQKNNGQAPDTTRSKVAKLVKTDYVLKKSNLGKKSDDQRVNQQVLLQRMAMLRICVEEPYLDITSIRDSGMLNMAADLYFDQGKLDKEEYEVIWKQFNLGKVFLNGELQDNIFPYRRDFLNIETINKLYGDFENFDPTE